MSEKPVQSDLEARTVLPEPPPKRADVHVRQPAIRARRPFVAGFWLIAAIPASIPMIAVFDALIRVDMDEAVGLPALALVHFAAGYLWARSLNRRTGRADSQLTNIAGGVGFAVFVWGGRAAVVAFEALIYRWLSPWQGMTHLEFGVIFVVWTGVVTGGTGMMFGLGALDWKLALRLLPVGFAGGAGVFLLVAFTMDALGFRVGTPRADGLPSMVITTLLGIWSAALLGSALFGRILVRSPAEQEPLLISDTPAQA